MWARTYVDRLLASLRITHRPVVKAYDGYGDRDEVVVYGHVLALGPIPRVRYRQNTLVNLFALIRLFVVRPVPYAKVRISWNGETREAVSDKEGFFKFEWKPLNPLVPGWQPARIAYFSKSDIELAHGECRIFTPRSLQYNLVSDIDDTFLVSHSTNLLKRLRVLVTRNARSRSPFEGVVSHYRLLSHAGAPPGVPNPFFYVSSSEWNLYGYIREFCRHNGMPEGVFLLSEMKRLSGLLKTGQGKHTGKYIRIARILKCYPAHKYVLLGDDTQEDPPIYSAIVRDFPGMVGWVYIRQVKSRVSSKARKSINEMEAAGARCCYFRSSAEAIAHSKATGLIRE